MTSYVNYVECDAYNYHPLYPDIRFITWLQQRIDELGDFVYMNQLGYKELS